MTTFKSVSEEDYQPYISIEILLFPSSPKAVESTGVLFLSIKMQSIALWEFLAESP